MHDFAARLGLPSPSNRARKFVAQPLSRLGVHAVSALLYIVERRNKSRRVVLSGSLLFSEFFFFPILRKNFQHLFNILKNLKMSSHVRCIISATSTGSSNETSLLACFG